MDILFHWLVPVVITIAFTKIDKRTILLLSPFALFPDIDAFFGMHRMVLHSLFIALIPLLLCIVFKSRKLELILISYFILSHIIFDLSYPGVMLFYPFINEMFYFSFDFMFDNWNIVPNFDYGVYHLEPTGKSLKGTFIGNLSIMMLIICLLFITFHHLQKINKKLKF